MKRNLITLLLAIGLFNTAVAATVTWDGDAGGGDWLDATNWDSDVLPGAADEVIIGSAAVVSLSGSASVAQVQVIGNAELTITATGVLTIDGAPSDDALLTSSSGTIINNGEIYITNIVGTNNDGIYNLGYFTNNNLIDIDGIDENGIHLGSGTFTNGAAGTINITNVGQVDINRDYINVDDTGGVASLMSNSGTINITMTDGDDGLHVVDGSTFDNSGTINISEAGGGDEGIFVENSGIINNNSGGIISITSGLDDGIALTANSELNNNAGASITIDGGNDDQIYLDNETTFNNSGTITLTNAGDIGLFVSDQSSFTNSASGTIDVSGYFRWAVFVDANSSTANLENAGTITIYDGDDDGMRVQEGGTITNTGSIDISDTSDHGLIIINPTSVFTNSGTLDISDVAQSGIHFGLTTTLGGTLNNSATINVTGGDKDGLRMINGGIVDNSGTITLTDSGDDAIQIDKSGSIINNSGTIDISNATNEGLEMIEGTFNNLVGALFNANNCGDDGIELNDATFNNDGDIRIDLSGSEEIESASGSTWNNSSTASFAPGSSPGDFEIDGDLDLGSSLTTFEINGLTPITDFDQMINFSGSTLTISSASMHIEWGSYTPAEGDCFKIIDGAGAVSGEFATVTSSNPAIDHSLNYDDPNEVQVCFTLVVPIELVDFSGEKIDRGTELKWQTASEKNNEGFQIERSADGSDWLRIGFVSGNGNSAELLEYTFLDKNPIAGISYYRLKQMDYDGNYEYSNIINIRSDIKKTQVAIHPNPVKDVLYIDIDSDLEEMELLLYDSRSRLIWSGHDATNEITFIDYSPGIYFLHVISASERTIHKVVKN